MSRAVTLRTRLATACAALRGHPSEDQRVDAMLTAIRATAPVLPPATRPLQLVLEPVAQPLLRTDTLEMPRIVLRAGAAL